MSKRIYLENVSIDPKKPKVILVVVASLYLPVEIFQEEKDSEQTDVILHEYQLPNNSQYTIKVVLFLFKRPENMNQHKVILDTV